MADDRGRGLPPPRDFRVDGTYFPPAPYHDDDRVRGYQPRVPPVTLPSIHDHALGAAPAFIDARDPQGSASYVPSPGGANGYQTPHPPAPPPNQNGPPPHYFPPVAEQRPPGPYHAYRQQAPPYGGHGYDYSGHPPPPQGFAAGYPQDYRTGQMQQPQMQAGAPRQRTSIACKYCRRRKIRCSGYQQGGKCSNCIKMNQECVFQPVSSSTSTAFIPISAVQGSLPPNTQLYGAYGQPLPQSQPGSHAPQHYPPPSEYPTHPMQSPTGNFPPASYDGRDRRRPREDELLPPRLPPPNPYPEQDARRRSPATSSTNSPGTYSSYPPPHVSGGYDVSGPTPTARRGSPGNGTPNQSSTGSVMSVGNIIDGPAPSRADSTIDHGMLTRLNRTVR